MCKEHILSLLSSNGYAIFACRVTEDIHTHLLPVHQQDVSVIYAIVLCVMHINTTQLAVAMASVSSAWNTTGKTTLGIRAHRAE